MFIPCSRTEIYKNHMFLLYIKNHLRAIETVKVLFAL